MGLLDKIKNLFGSKEQTEIIVSPELSAETETVPAFDYVSLVAAFTGLKNKKKETVCRIDTRAVSTEKLCMTILADGDSTSAVRGERGAQLACAAAEAAFQAFNAETVLNSMDERKRYESFLLLAKDILVRWKAAVADDLAKEPLDEGEAAYDAELIAALCTPEYTLIVRCGQGACVIFDEKGSPSSAFPRTRKKEIIDGGVLCSRNAMMNFRFHYTESSPAAIWLYNYGVDRAHSKAEDLHATTAQLSYHMAENGINACKTMLEEKLEQIAESKNVGDVSAVGILSKHSLTKNKSTLEHNIKYHELRCQAEEMRRRLAAIMHQLRETQTALKTISERMESSRSELEDMSSNLWTIPGLELSAVELEGLRDGLKANEEKKQTLENTAERLRAERDLLNEQLAALSEQMKFLTESTEKKGDTK